MDRHRRAILVAGLAATAQSVHAGAAAEGPAAAQTKSAPPQLDGRLSFDQDSRNAAAQDFGRIIRHAPESVLHPASDRDVATIIRWAGDSGRKVAPRGQGHSVYGRSQVRDGVVIDMTPLRAIHEIRDDRIVVGAGATWRDALAATLPRGLAPPVLADYLDLSIGGSLAVGGVGGATSRHGMQIDNVLELDVVTGEGEKIACSPLGNADLFHATLAGLGQVGVVVRATLKLIPAPKNARRYILAYANLGALLADERRLADDDRFDAVQGAILPAATGFAFRLDAVRYFSGDAPPDDNALLAGLSDDRSAAQLSTLRYFDYLNRLAPLEQRLRSNGQWLHPHPWLMTFVGDSKIESVVGGELERLTPGDLGRFGQIALSAFRWRRAGESLLRPPDDDLFYAFNLVRFPETDDAAEADRLVKANRAIYERIRAAGGVLYPVSAFPMSRDDWRRHFGPAWPGFRRAKRRFDPRGVLTPGYEIFQDP